jgi:hypothetical protein
MFLAAILTWHLVFMPIPTGGLTQANRDLFKPFDTGKTFGSEEACRADGNANKSEYLRRHGLPDGAMANMGCTRQ